MTKKSCFIICPIGSEGSPERKRANDLLRYIINKSLDGLDYSILRADQIAKPGIITTQIIENLIEADLVIADLYDYNPNVFYELGIRHAVGKPVIQIYHPDQRIPFDVAGLRSIKLNMIDLESVDRCINELNLQIKAVEDNPTEIMSPFSVTIDLQTLRSSSISTETLLSRIMDSIENLRSEIIPPKRIPSKVRISEIERLLAELDNLHVKRKELEKYHSEMQINLFHIQQISSKTKEDMGKEKFLLQRVREVEERLIEIRGRIKDIYRLLG
ncbi:MAG: hypothetical protein ACFE9L_12010 [Candidatus Hodarchaeota archaeon]